MRLLRMIGPPFLALGACGDPLARVGRVWEGPVLPAAETERGAKDLFGWLHDVSIAEAAPEAIAGVGGIYYEVLPSQQPCHPA